MENGSRLIVEIVFVLYTLYCSVDAMLDQNFFEPIKLGEIFL